MAKDQDIDLARSIITIRCNQQMQHAANSKVDERRQHRHSK
jgi:hypothetical protein